MKKIIQVVIILIVISFFSLSVCGYSVTQRWWRAFRKQQNPLSTKNHNSLLARLPLYSPSIQHFHYWYRNGPQKLLSASQSSHSGRHHNEKPIHRGWPRDNLADRTKNSRSRPPPTGSLFPETNIPPQQQQQAAESSTSCWTCHHLYKKKKRRNWWLGIPRTNNICRIFCFFSLQIESLVDGIDFVCQSLLIQEDFSHFFIMIKPS